MMCSRLRRAARENAVAAAIGAGSERLERGYAPAGRLASAAPGRCCRWSALVLGSGVALFQRTPSELAPSEDRGYIRATVRGPRGRRSTGPPRNLEPARADHGRRPEVASTFLIAGVPEVTRGIAIVRLKPWEERERSQQEILTALRPQLRRCRAWWRHPAARPRSARTAQPAGAARPPDQRQLRGAGRGHRSLRARGRGVAWHHRRHRRAHLATPQLEVDFDRQKIADLGLERRQASAARWRRSSAGRTVTRFNRNAEQYDVIVQVADADRKEPDDLAAIYVRGRGGEMIQLSNLVEMRETVAAKELTRFNQLRSATVTPPWRPATRWARPGAFSRPPPARCSRHVPLDYSPSREFKQAGRSILLIFGLALGVHLPAARRPVRELPRRS